MGHRIRLRGAWQTTWPLIPYVDSPLQWAQLCRSGFQGEVQFSRIFHAPSGLAPTSCVKFVLPPLFIPFQLELNNDINMSFEGDKELRLEIRDKLLPTNRVAIRMQLPRDAEGPVPDSTSPPIHLEIEEDSRSE